MSRNTLTPFYLHIYTDIAIWFALIFSLEFSFKRENYTHAIIPLYWGVQK